MCHVGTLRLGRVLSEKARNGIVESVLAVFNLEKGARCIYRLFNVNKKKWRPKGHFPNQPKMANYARSITRGERCITTGDSST